MDEPNLPPGVPPTAEGGVPVQPTIDTTALYPILDSLMHGLGQDAAMYREKYDGILNTIKADVIGDVAAATSIAASDLAARPHSFEIWATSVNLFNLPRTHPDVRLELNRLKERIRYPRGLLDVDGIVDVRERNVRDFAQSVKKWVTDDQAIKWDTTSQVPNLWQRLLVSWSHSKNAVQNKHNEASQRPLVDAMLQLVFFQYSTEGKSYEVLLEMPVALPQPASKPEFESKFAKADAIVLREIPEPLFIAIVLTLNDAKIPREQIECLFRSSSSNGLVGAFAVESKRLSIATVEYQVVMDLCSIQYQRRILGLKDKCVYGATYAAGIFSLFACMWKRETLHWMPVQSCTWNLMDPAEFIQCLYFLWELRKHLEESFEDDFNTLNENTVLNNVKGQTRSWRYSSNSNQKKRGNDGKSQSSSKRSKTGGQGVDAAEDLDIVDYNDDVGIAVDADDDSGNIPRASRPLTLQDVVTNLPFIYDQLVKLVRVEEWKKSIAASEHEGTLFHADEGDVAMGK